MANISYRTKVKAYRLPNDLIAELEYAAKLHNHTVNEEVVARLRAGAVEVPPEMVEGQMQLNLGD